MAAESINVTRKVVILTGSTGGLGKALARLIANRSEPIELYATSRAGVDLGIRPSNPKSAIHYPKLDITDVTSIDALVELVKREHGKLDVLINNAGGSQFEKEEGVVLGPEVVQDVFNLNYFAVINTIKACLPLMKPGGRVVTVGSTASFQLKFANPALKKRAMDDKLGLEDLEQLFQEYKAASSKPEDDDGWNRAGYAPAYSASKGFMNLATAALAREHPELIINVGCPGICETAEIPKGVNWVLKTTDEGCRLPLRLAFDDLDGVNGQFWAGKSTADKGPGVVVPDWPGKEIVWDTN